METFQRNTTPARQLQPLVKESPTSRVKKKSCAISALVLDTHQEINSLACNNQISIAAGGNTNMARGPITKEKARNDGENQWCRDEICSLLTECFLGPVASKRAALCQPAGEKKRQPLPRLLCPFLARFKGPYTPGAYCQGKKKNLLVFKP